MWAPTSTPAPASAATTRWGRIRRAVLAGDGSDPFGPVTLVEDGACWSRLDWRDDPGESSDLLDEALRQLRAYFDRRLTRL